MIKTSYPKNKIKVLLLENVHERAVSLFEDAGYTNIERVKSALSENDLLKKMKDVHLLGIRSKTKLTKKILESSPRLLAAGAFCIGTNQIDMTSATQNGVAIFNSPFSNTRSVAELVMAECILLMRKAGDKSMQMHNGQWDKSSAGCYEVRGKILGIIGYGHIGSQVSVLAESLGMKVIYYDIIPKLPLGNAVAAKNISEVLKNSDIVTVHVPGLPSTKNLIDASFIKQMKKGAVLINNARGDIAVENDIHAALKSKMLGGFASDVFNYEPASNDEAFESPFRNMPNTFLTPHIGGSTEEAQENIGLDVASKIIQYIDTGSTTGSLSVPDLNLPMQQDTHRLLHIHKNIPGVLGEINSILSSLNVNILGQYLKTNNDIGYVVLDVDRKTPVSALDAMKEVKGTIRVRSLY